jgi:hypothetical protein
MPRQGEESSRSGRMRRSDSGIYHMYVYRYIFLYVIYVDTVYVVIFTSAHVYLND